jgi:hypothetical protein
MRQIYLFLIILIVACQPKEVLGSPVKQIRIVLPEAPSDQLGQIVSVFAQQVQERCGATVTTQGEALLTVSLSVDPAIGREGFRISDRAGGGIDVVGQNELGILYGLGKFLRTSRFSEDGFVPGTWRGESIPKKPIRGIYFATHFHNFYQEAPIETIQRYVQELALWGCNNLMIWYDMHHFDGYNDPNAVTFRNRLDGILKTASDLGIGTSFMVIGNEGYNNSPPEIRSQGGRRGGYYECQICPNKPGALEYEVRIQTEVMDWMRPHNPKYICIWPFDQGGCSCDQCEPWALNGFLKCAKPISYAARQKLPGVKVILSNWYYKEHEKEALGKILATEEDSWVDYVMGPVPGSNVPAVNFPEISMQGVKPWGGYGAIPIPNRLEYLPNLDTIHKFSSPDMLFSPIIDNQGGWMYSEGLFEDMNKIMVLQEYWNPDQSVFEALREYAAYEFSSEVVEDVVSIVKILENNFPRDQIGSDALKAHALAEKVNTSLTSSVRKSWRWRILYLRALIDKEMHITKADMKGTFLYLQKNQQRGAVLREAFAELTRIYHAENALKMWLRPLAVINSEDPSGAEVYRDHTTAASSELSVLYQSGNASDGIPSEWDLDNCWSSDSEQDVGAWWQKDLGKKVPIKNVQIQFRNISGHYHFVPKTITFQVSDDGKKWTTVLSKLADVPANNSPYSEKLNYYDINAKGRYVRLLFEDGTDDRVDGSKMIQLVEVNVLKR